MVAINSSRIIRFAINANESGFDNNNLDETFYEDVNGEQAPSPNELVTSGHPKVTIKTEEAVILFIILSIWVGVILVFIKQWGKIRMLEPYQPSYVAAEVVPLSVSPSANVKLLTPKSTAVIQTVGGIRLAHAARRVANANALTHPQAFGVRRPMSGGETRKSFSPIPILEQPCCVTCGTKLTTTTTATIATTSYHEPVIVTTLASTTASSSERSMSAGSLASSSELMKNWRKYKSVENITLYMMNSVHNNYSNSMNSMNRIDESEEHKNSNGFLLPL